MSEARTALFHLSDLDGPSEELRDRYALFKMGVHDAVAYFAEKLGLLVERIAVDQQAALVVTAPPFATIPAAANLLAAATVQRLGRSAAAACSLVEIPEGQDQSYYAAVQSHDDYSRLDWQAREASRAQLAHAAIPLEAFRGQVVLFINDIRVTGAQERVMRNYFAALHARHVHWLYLVEVDEEDGRREPQIEHRLNRSGIASLEDLARLFATADLTFTSKAVATLLAYDQADLLQLLEAVPMNRRLALCELVRQEERYAGDHFAAKRASLEKAVRDSN